MLRDPLLATIAQIVAALGSLVLAILAIWGDWVRDKLGVRPKLTIKLRDAKGNLTTQADGKKVLYWHLMVTNDRSWIPAERVRIMCTEIKKRVPDGSFRARPIAIPVQLTWAFPAFHELLPTITTNDECDLGLLVEGGRQFRLSTYIVPNNFQGFVKTDQAMQVTLIAKADNYNSKPYRLEISWDGQWHPDAEEMSHHLIIKEVT